MSIRPSFEPNFSSSETRPQRRTCPSSSTMAHCGSLILAILLFHRLDLELAVPFALPGMHDGLRFFLARVARDVPAVEEDAEDGRRLGAGGFHLDFSGSFTS